MFKSIFILIMSSIFYSNLTGKCHINIVHYGMLPISVNWLLMEMDDKTKMKTKLNMKGQNEKQPQIVRANSMW